MDPNPYKPIWETIAERIKEDIISGVYLPGDRLTENELSTKYASSKTPVKEALRYLEGIGFVEIIPYKMTRVRSLNKEEVADLYSIESLLEGLAARKATLNLTKAQLGRLEKYVGLLEKAHEEQHPSRYEKANLEFHALIWQASNSTKLQAVINSIREQLQRFRTITRRYLEEFSDLMADHQRILEAFVQKDPLAAEQLVRRHFEKSGKIIVALLQREKGL